MASCFSCCLGRKGKENNRTDKGPSLKQVSLGTGALDTRTSKKRKSKTSASADSTNLPKGWIVLEGRYFNVCTGGGRDIKPVFTIQPAVSRPGYPELSDLAQVRLDQVFLSWFNSFDAACRDAGYSEDPDFVLLVGDSFFILTKFAQAIFEKRKSEIGSRRSKFDWRQHYLENFTQPSLKKITLLKAVKRRDNKQEKKLIKIFESIWQYRKQVTLLIAEIYKLLVICAMVKPQQRFAIEGINKSVPFQHDSAVHKFLGDDKPREGAHAIIVIPAVVSPFQDDSVTIPAYLM